MKRFNYDKFPSTKISGVVTCGWQDIIAMIQSHMGHRRVLAIDLYLGVYESEIFEAFSSVVNATIIDVRSLLKSESEILNMTSRYMTNDVLFGYVSPLRLDDYFDEDKLSKCRCDMAASEECYIVIGTGAARVADDAMIVYADMARWEIQQRFRRHEVKAFGVDNHAEAPSLQYKRGYFNDWRICDRHKDEYFGKIEFWIDTHEPHAPKMIDRATFMRGIEQTASGPFRVVPFFDPAPWGGQWMKEVCDLDRSQENFGWCFDCVPEENSLYFEIEDHRFEIPAVDLVLLKSRALLGEAVEARFGKDFPIRFDFLDTMGGGNLSLQVHPTTQFIYDNFGMKYTQDESYYLLDAEDDATVFLGVKEGINRDAMIADLKAAQRGEIVFDAEKYVNRISARKHDHFLIPGGTIHCSGANSLVLEISSTPNIFTFKLWDWQRLGLDGKPRPINIERGEKVINWRRDTDYVYNNLYNQVSVVDSGSGWVEERTGLHQNEFIETRRHRFTAPVKHNTYGSVNVLNLVEGDVVSVESVNGEFEPFEVHYAETFIVPAAVGEYIIRPCGECDKEYATIKAYVRF